ncbi:hypothetical protein CES87_29275 [Pseudomonas sp. ERMR1:02]|nr:hypothetical protein CES87_29275 [Pseudomonas sp. ERMR1:02]
MAAGGFALTASHLEEPVGAKLARDGAWYAAIASKLCSYREPALGLSMGQADQKPNQKRARRPDSRPDCVDDSFHCRSEPAREKRPDNAFIQTGRVIVDVHREQASLLQRNAFIRNQVGCQAASLCF